MEKQDYMITEENESALREALDKAILLAVKYHSGQRDKQGENYILHPLRVMLKETTLTSRMIAVLHDILEDTECTVEMLREEGIPECVIERVQRLTKQENEKYFSYIDRVKEDSVCAYVKQMDIGDNLRDGCPETLQKRYHKALEILKTQNLPTP